MARIIVADAETFYDSKAKYSLRSMSNEAYLRDRRFQLHGMAVAEGDGPGEFLTQKEFVRWAQGIDWPNVILVGHNLFFDGAILAWRYGIRPGLYIDTMGLANAFVKPFTNRVSLDRCALFLGMPTKTSAIKDVDGMRTEQIVATPGLWDRFAAYAIQDLDVPRELVRRYYGRLNNQERRILSWTIENYVRGRLRIDTGILQQAIDDIEEERKEFLVALGLTDDGDSLRSANKLATLLHGMGIDVEYKKGKEGDIPAIAKKDDFMVRLLQSDNVAVRTLAQARVAFSSNIEATRSKRILEMARNTGGTMQITLNYSSARTGRFGGGGGANPQNLGRKSPIRRAIHCLQDQRIVTCDASQIEARIVAWLAKCHRLVHSFANGGDPYCDFATVAFGHPVNKKDHPEKRQVGKVSILQLGYQSGYEKLWRKLGESGCYVTMEEAKYYTDTYRITLYPEIPALWRTLERLMRTAIQTGKPQHYAAGLVFTDQGIRLPSGRWIYLYNLCLDSQGQPQFFDPKWKSWISYYGGRITENVCQAMARDCTFEAMDNFLSDTVLQVHDDFSQIVPLELAKQRRDETIEIMSQAPAWANDPVLGRLPLGAEGMITSNLLKDG